MARFIHFTAERNAGSVRRAGLRPRRWKGGLRSPGVFAMPMGPRFEVTHQWAREIKRWTGRTLVAVTFEIPDAEPVEVGRYNAPHASATAAKAVAKIHALPDARGWEVVIPRAIPPKAILRVRPVRRITGWRYYPDAHGREPCGCPACTSRGEPYSRKLRDAFDAQESADAARTRSQS